jgi:ketosteroid isomerase-like protein
MSTAIATPKKQFSRDEAEILALIEAVHQAHHNKDAAAIAAPYVREAAIFDLAPPLFHPGVDIQQKKAWLDTWDGPIERESRDLNITVSGDFAFCHGFYRMGGTSKAAGRPISFWMRATVCLLRDKDAWRIVHEHTSVPFYMDGSLRPAFDLEP